MRDTAFRRSVKSGALLEGAAPPDRPAQTASAAPNSARKAWRWIVLVTVMKAQKK